MPLRKAVALLVTVLFSSSESRNSHNHPRLLTIRDDLDTIGIPACNAPKIVSCRRVEVNFEAVSAHTVEIFNGMTMSSKKDLDDGLGGFGFEGEDGSDAILTVSFRRRTLIAAISTVQPDRFYTVEPCPGHGCHVFIEESEEQNKPVVDTVMVDRSAMYTIAGFALPGQFSGKEIALEISRRNQNETAVITASFYYTPAFKQVTSDTRGYIEGLVNSANLAYNNSEINLKLEIFCIEELTDFEESEESVRMLENFRSWRGSDDAILNTADVAILVISGPRGGACGIAYVNGYQYNSNFGWVAKNCHQAVTPHEIGHMFGAAHNKEISTNFVPNGGFEYGALIPGGYVSVMAYETDVYNKRIMYFSSPEALWNGNATGDANADVRRALLERKFIMSRKGDESGQCPRRAASSTTSTTTTTPTTTTTTTVISTQTTGSTQTTTESRTPATTTLTTTPSTTTSTPVPSTTTSTCGPRPPIFCEDDYWTWYCQIISFVGCCNWQYGCSNVCRATCGVCEPEPTPAPSDDCEDLAGRDACSSLAVAFNCCRWNCNQFCRSTCDTCRTERGPLGYMNEQHEKDRDKRTATNGDKYKIIY